MNIKSILIATVAAGFLFSCDEQIKEVEETTSKFELVEFDNSGEFSYPVDKFGDIEVIRYKIPSWENLSMQQKKYAYYLTMAGYAGREIIFDQNYRHNLSIKRALENVYANFEGDRDSEDFKNMTVYLKRIWFANGIHHHYSNEKFKPGFSAEFLDGALAKVGATLTEEAKKAIFDESYDSKKVNLSKDVDLVQASAVNFYGSDLTQKEVEGYYLSVIDSMNTTPVEYGLNSQLVKDENGNLMEKTYKKGGMYDAAITEIIGWLEKAITVTENAGQADALQLLVEYYKTGDLKLWSQYNIAWVGVTDGDIDYINSFIEVYNDPLGYSGSFETVVELKDFKMTEIMSVVAENVQWFEDNAPLMLEHKKKEVKGVSYKVVDVAGEAGDASPSTPIGVNLPNANWIRSTHGSKSVSLGNIISAYSEAGGDGILGEFANDEKEIELAKAHGKTAGKMHTALHEVVGHASGQLNLGVKTPKETLKNYSSTLEEARADLVGLYYILDQKMVDLGLVKSLDVGIAEYDGYIRNGMMTQLSRLDLGAEIEEAHMRNRQLVASWAFEKGQADSVITKLTRDGKTYFEVNDYNKLRDLFGQLLKEIQRIKSEGDFEAGKNLVENYGVKVDQAIHKEVLDRVKPLNIQPYRGFVNPKIVPMTNEEGEIIDFKIEYQNFDEQMLEYAKRFSFLPEYN
ncbi:dihydrofolate reductase [Flavobacteriales bacterium]|nr:dihydrofolate reductase [Flavobacteriales bacterium]